MDERRRLNYLYNKSMKSLYITLSLFGLLIVSAVFSTNLTGQEQGGGNATDDRSSKKLVILTGDDLNHACGTHEFEAGGKLLKASIEESSFAEQIDCVLVHNWPEDTSVFNDADMILHYYKGNKTHHWRCL